MLHRLLCLRARVAAARHHRSIDRLRNLATDRGGEIDALDLALVCLILLGITLALGGPSDAIESADRVIDRFVNWIG